MRCSAERPLTPKTSRSRRTRRSPPATTVASAEPRGEVTTTPVCSGCPARAAAAAASTRSAGSRRSSSHSPFISAALTDSSVMPV